MLISFCIYCTVMDPFQCCVCVVLELLRLDQMMSLFHDDVCLYVFLFLSISQSRE